MRNEILYLLICILVLVSAYGFIPDQTDKTDGEYRTIENNAFDVGETLTFWLGWQGINGGEAVLSVVDTVKVGDRWAYHIKSVATSNKTISVFFKVEDRVETYVDVKGIFPFWFEKHLSEGKYKADRYYTFDQLNNVVITGKNDTIKIPEYTQDILSSFYFMRTQKLEPGKSFYISNFDNGKNYKVEVKVYKKEKVKVDAGKFNCIKIEPLLESEGLFRKQGRLYIWLTDDERHIPVLMRSKAIIGAFEARLISMKGVKK